MPTFQERMKENTASVAQREIARRRQREGLRDSLPDPKLAAKARRTMWEYFHHVRHKLGGR